MLVRVCTTSGRLRSTHIPAVTRITSITTASIATRLRVYCCQGCSKNHAATSVTGNSATPATRAQRTGSSTTPRYGSTTSATWISSQNAITCAAAARTTWRRCSSAKKSLKPCTTPPGVSLYTARPSNGWRRRQSQSPASLVADSSNRCARHLVSAPSGSSLSASRASAVTLRPSPASACSSATARYRSAELGCLDR